MRKKTILFLTPYPYNVAPSQRLKFEQYYDYFKAAGYEIKLESFMSLAFWGFVYKKQYFIKLNFPHANMVGYSCKRPAGLTNIHYTII
jgi:hypothetical protein